MRDRRDEVEATAATAPPPPHRQEHPLPPSSSDAIRCLSCSSRAGQRCGRAVPVRSSSPLAQADSFRWVFLPPERAASTSDRYVYGLSASLAYVRFSVHHLKQYCKLQRQSRICRPYISLTDQGPGEANFLISGLWPSREVSIRGLDAELRSDGSRPVGPPTATSSACVLLVGQPSGRLQGCDAVSGSGSTSGRPP